MTSIKSVLRMLMPRGGFGKSVAHLAGGSIVGQVIALMAAPVLTRLYTPTDFGVLAVYMSLVTVFGVVACLRYEAAVALPESDREAANLVVLSVVMCLFVASFIAFGLYFFSNLVFELLKIQDLGLVKYFIPLGVLVLGLFSVMSYWTVRQKEYLLVSKARVVQVVTSVTWQLFMFSFAPISLLIGNLLGQIVSVIILVKSGVVSLGKYDFTICSLYRVLVRYRRFPLASTWASLLNRISAQLPTLMFTGLFGPAVAGFYALTMRVVSIPSGVVSQAIHYVYLTSVADAYAKGSAGLLTAKTLNLLSRLVIPPVIVFAFVSVDLFSLVFGATWAEAGVYARLLSPLIYFSVVISPFMVLFSVLEEQVHEFFFQLLFLVLRLASILLGWSQDSVLLSVFLYSVGSVVGYGFFMCWVSHMLKIKFAAILLPILYGVIIGTICVLPVYLRGCLPLGGIEPIYSYVVMLFMLGFHLYLLRRCGSKQSS